MFVLPQLLKYLPGQLLPLPFQNLVAVAQHLNYLNFNARGSFCSATAVCGWTVCQYHCCGLSWGKPVGGSVSRHMAEAALFST